jgi:tetratricopeptide (TPR) repeat protein
MTSRQLADAAELLLETDPTSALDGACLAHATARDEPERARAALLAARVRLAQGAWPDAIAWLDRVPSLPVAPALRAWARFSAGHVVEGLAELEAAAAAAPALAEAHLRRGAAYAALDRHAEAIAALSPAATAEDPLVAGAARRLRACALLANGNRADAIADLAAAARAGDVPAIEQLRELGVAPKKLADKIADATHARTRDDAAERCAVLLAGAELAADQRAHLLAVRANAANYEGDWAAAVALRVEAVAARPRDAKLHAELAHELWNTGRFDDAIAAAERAIAAGSTAGAAEQTIAMSHHVARRLAEAERWYRAALALRVRNTDVMFQLARVLVELGRDDDGLALFVEAAAFGHEGASEHLVELEAAEPADWQRAGVASLGAGDHSEAATSFRNEAELWTRLVRAPGDTASERVALALSNAGCALRLGGDPEAAEAAASQAIAMRPTSRDAWAHRGDHLYMLGRFDDALGSYARAHDLDPRHAWPLYGASAARRAIGDVTGALAAIDAAIAIGYPCEVDKQCDLHLRRAQLLQAIGDWDGAASEYAARASLAHGHPAYALPALNVGVARELAGRPRTRLAPPAYRRYGLALDMWVHTAFPFVYRVQLADVPDAATRVALAGAFRRALAMDRFTLDTPWRWSDRFVLVTVSPTEVTRPHPRTAFAELAKAFDAMHVTAPLREVVALGARSIDREDLAERWSIAAQPVPDAGPFFGAPAELWVEALGDARRFPAPFVDPEVERARRSLARALVETAAIEPRAY